MAVNNPSEHHRDEQAAKGAGVVIAACVAIMVILMVGVIVWYNGYLG